MENAVHKVQRPQDADRTQAMQTVCPPRMGASPLYCYQANLRDLQGVPHDVGMPSATAIRASDKLTSLRPREAAAALRVTEATVINMIRRGALRNVAAQRCRRIDPGEIAELLIDDWVGTQVLRGLLDGSSHVLAGRRDEVPRAAPVPSLLRPDGPFQRSLT